VIKRLEGPGGVIAWGRGYPGWVAFMDNDHVVLAWTVRPAAVALARPGAAASAYELHSVVISVRTARVIAAPVWPMHAPDSKVIATNDRGVVLMTGGDLVQVSPELKVARTLRLPDSQMDGWSTNASWSGDHVLLDGAAVGRFGPELWLDARSLTIEHRWSWTSLGGYAVEDGDMLMWGAADEPNGYYIRDLVSHWRPFPAASIESREARFVGPGLVAYELPPCCPASSFRLARIDGSAEAEIPGELHGWNLTPSPGSRSGSRYLFWENKGDQLRGLLIFDHGSLTPDYDVPLAGTLKGRMQWGAISPDGLHLAIANYKQVLIYSLPPIGPAGR